MARGSTKDCRRLRRAGSVRHHNSVTSTWPGFSNGGRWRKMGGPASQWRIWYRARHEGSRRLLVLCRTAAASVRRALGALFSADDTGCWDSAAASQQPSEFSLSQRPQLSCWPRTSLSPLAAMHEKRSFPERRCCGGVAVSDRRSKPFRFMQSVCCHHTYYDMVRGAVVLHLPDLSHCHCDWERELCPTSLLCLLLQ